VVLCDDTTGRRLTGETLAETSFSFFIGFTTAVTRGEGVGRIRELSSLPLVESLQSLPSLDITGFLRLSTRLLGKTGGLSGGGILGLLEARVTGRRGGGGSGRFMVVFVIGALVGEPSKRTLSMLCDFLTTGVREERGPT
jgi:hypothetical protein